MAMDGHNTRFSLVCMPGRTNCITNMSSRGNDSTIPAKNDSFIESMNVSVGFKADIMRRLPRLSISGLGAVLIKTRTCALKSSDPTSAPTKASRLSLGKARAARSNSIDCA